MIPYYSVRFGTSQRNVGMAYTEFPTEQIASQVIEDLDGTTFFNRVLYVRPHVPYSPRHSFTQGIARRFSYKRCEDLEAVKLEKGAEDAVDDNALNDVADESYVDNSFNSTTSADFKVKHNEELGEVAKEDTNQELSKEKVVKNDKGLGEKKKGGKRKGKKSKKIVIMVDTVESSKPVDSAAVDTTIEKTADFHTAVDEEHKSKVGNGTEHNGDADAVNNGNSLTNNKDNPKKNGNGKGKNIDDFGGNDNLIRKLIIRKVNKKITEWDIKQLLEGYRTPSVINIIHERSFSFRSNYVNIVIKFEEEIKSEAEIIDSIGVIEFMGQELVVEPYTDTSRPISQRVNGDANDSIEVINGDKEKSPKKNLSTTEEEKVKVSKNPNNLTTEDQEKIELVHDLAELTLANSVDSSELEVKL